MSLPGKLCIGILEEDNPLKSYFRFKPLLVEEDGRYTPYTQLSAYPEEGCIRIVPDKNESYHFKTRMRDIGLFCVVDLRGHPDGNDKIRPNKNYREGASEKNAFIIYSDVVKSPDPDSIFEILSPESAEAPLAAPRTARVLTDGAAGALAACSGASVFSAGAAWRPAMRVTNETTAITSTATKIHPPPDSSFRRRRGSYSTPNLPRARDMVKDFRFAIYSICDLRFYLP